MPSVPTIAELELVEAGPPAEPVQEPRPLDVPAREQFTQPVRATAPAKTASPRPLLEDSPPWEARPGQEEDGE
jgi:hypothetical protein